MTPEELRQRTKLFSLRVIRLVGALPGTVTGRAIAGQLVRAGTSVGANYRAVCRARSRKEFVAKLGVVIEEADESGFWLELVIESGLLPARLVEPRLQEPSELVSIMVSARRTAARRLRRPKADRPDPKG